MHDWSDVIVSYANLLKSTLLTTIEVFGTYINESLLVQGRHSNTQAVFCNDVFVELSDLKQCVGWYKGT